MTDFEQIDRVDVLIVGAGAAGLTAAIAAREAGASVLIIEKAAACGGNTALSSGSLPGAGTRFQRQRGIHDSAARFVADLARVEMDAPTRARAATLAELSAKLIEWMVDVADVRLQLIEDYRHVGHSVPRLHAPASRRGSDLLSDLERAARQRDIPVAFRTKLLHLETDADKVTGARVVSSDNARYSIPAGATILATNGFGASRELLKQHITDATRFVSFGAPTSTGDGIVAAQAIGAGVENMGAFQGHGSISAKLQSLVTWTVIEHGGVMVDSNGDRFGDESIGYSAFAEVAAAHPGPHYVVFSDDIADRVSHYQSDFAELMRLGAATTAQTQDELAGMLRLPADRLVQSITWSSTAKCHAIEVLPALFHTQGGLSIDVEARVLRTDQTVLPGLYAAGGAAAGISGTSGAAGYTSGNGLLSACGLGFLAGRAAARSLMTVSGTGPDADIITHTY
ncbi:MAG: FAD-dependent oxidoreductase [Pseudomonadota bacterium]